LEKVLLVSALKRTALRCAGAGRQTLGRSDAALAGAFPHRSGPHTSGNVRGPKLRISSSDRNATRPRSTASSPAHQ